MHARLRMLALNSERNLDGNLIMVICAHLNIAHGAWRIVAEKKIYLSLSPHIIAKLTNFNILWNYMRINRETRPKIMEIGSLSD